jgi:hypothetical protein
MNCRLRVACSVLGVGLLAVGTSTVVHAHFKLIEPASWLIEGNLGDPQKLAPCGSLLTSPEGQPGVPLSNVIGKAVGGSKLHIKVQETVYHPGHYRVALSVNSREELPADPMTFERTTDRGPMSVWAAIQSPPQIPVMADGLFAHYTPPTPPAGSGAAQRPVWESDIQLPNITCPKCTLQVLQFMAEHPYNQPGGYSYHHCADLAITADPSKPIDKGWPAPK